MRIAQITATFPPYRGGTGNVCFHNARELARRGHEVQVFTAAVPGAPEREQVAGFEVRRLRPLARVGNAPLLPGLLGALRGFDLLHLHYPFILGAEMVRLAAMLYRVPMVLSFHNDLIGDGSRKHIFSAYQSVSAWTTVRSAATLCAVSIDHYRSSALCASLGKGEPPVCDLPNGVDVECFTPGEPPAVLRARYAPQQGDRLLLMVAGLDRAHHFKGVPVLLRALAGLPRRVRAVIVGDGDLRAKYEREAARLGLAERAIFAGAVDQEDTPQFFRAADLTILPSSPPESFGLVLIESLACGTPVIASNIPGVRTVVNHGQDGLLVRRGDAADLAGAIKVLLADDPLRQAMGQAGRAKVLAHYSWPAIGDQLEALYEQVLRERWRAPELQEAGGRQ